MADRAATARRGVLVTRPEPGASDTAARLAALGFEPVLAPLLTIDLVPADLPDPAQVQAVLAASGNAVAGLPEAYRAVSLLAVGDATAARARAAGFARVDSAGGDARDLAEYAARLCDPAGLPLVLACAQDQGRALAADLRARGFAVLRHVVYAARPVDALPPAARDALDGGTLSAALFFSAETARCFVRLVLAAGMDARVAGVEALAIGWPVSVALEPLPWRRVRVADQPTQDVLLALLA